MHFRRNLLHIALLLLIATEMGSPQLGDSLVKANSDNSQSLHADTSQASKHSSQALPDKNTYKFYNGSHIVNRQTDPDIPAWARAYALRGKQTFVTTNPVEKNYLMQMMGEMCELAIAAVQSMGTPETPLYSSSFLRYFDEGEWGDVRDGFRALLGSDCAGPINGPDELKYMRIYWDTGPVTMAEVPGMTAAMACEKAPTSYAFGVGNLNNPDVEKHEDLNWWLVFCPVALEYRNVFRPFDCSLLVPRFMDWRFLVGGQMMMHELMHWTYISEKAVKGGEGANGIKDWNTNSITGNPIDLDMVPVSGYGPFDAMLVNKLHGRGSENPDNYVWFAFESYLLQDKPGQCGGDAMDPPLTEFEDPV